MTDRQLRIRRWLLLIVGGALVAAVISIGWRQHAPPATPVANRAFVSAADPQAPAELWAVGDGADGSAAAKQVAALMHQGNPERVLYLGDVYETGTALDFKQGVADVYGSLVHRIAPTPGNHDWPNHRGGYDDYWAGVTGAPTPPWYSFDAGGWHLVGLNSETPSDPRQLAWLRADLARHPGTCTLAFMHRPRFNAGRHGDASDLDPIWQELRGHTTLVLSGHDHNMQRLHAIDGMTQYISGAGGHSHYKVHTKDPRLAWSNDQLFGALRLALSPGSAQLAFVDTTGRVLDRSAARCTAA